MGESERKGCGVGWLERFSRPDFRYHNLADSNTSFLDEIFHKLELEVKCSTGGVGYL